MSSLTTEFVTNLLNHYFKNAAHPSVGDATGLPASATAGNLYLALHAADPGDNGTQASSEVAYQGYARASLARGAGFTVSGKNVSPAADAGFGKCTAATTVTALFWSVGTDSSGAGHLILRGGIGAAPKPFCVGAANLAGDAIACPGHGLTVGDRVVFWQYEAITLPTGLAEGTAYWVKTVVDADTFTVSASQGGAVVDLTAAGQGTCQKLTPLVVTQNVTPKLETGTIIKFQ